MLRWIYSKEPGFITTVLDLIDDSENPDVVFPRIQLAKEVLSVFHRYEIKGIDTIEPEPSNLLEKFENKEGEILLDTSLKLKRR